MLKVVLPVGAVLLFAMVATNPSEGDHTRVLAAHMKRVCWDVRAAKPQCPDHLSSTHFGVVYDDRLLYSSARLGEVETLGLFGQVMILSQ